MINQKRQNVESWNLDTTLQVYKASCMPILGVKGSRDNDLGTLKPTKNGYFWAEIFFISLLTKKQLNVKSWNFGHNMGSDKQCMHTKFGGSQSRDRNFWGGKRSKSGKF